MIWPASAGRNRGTVPTERRAQAGPVMRAGTGLPVKGPAGGKGLVPAFTAVGWRRAPGDRPSFGPLCR